MPPRNQSLRRRASCHILYNGTDVTDYLNPFLISVTVNDVLAGYGTDSLDRAVVELDDRDGRLDIPPNDGGTLTVYLGWAGSAPQLDQVPPQPRPPATPSPLGWEADAGLVFNGNIQNCESAFHRGGHGRRLFIEATGANMSDPAKTGQISTMGAGDEKQNSGNVLDILGVGSTFGQAVTAILKAAGIQNVSIAPTIANKTRKFWAQRGNSALDWVDLFSTELGYRFKFSNGTVQIIDEKNPQGNLNNTLVNGKTAPEYSPVQGATENAWWGTQSAFEAWWGVNLIAWRIKPYEARSEFVATRSSWFDSVNGVIKTVTNDIAKGVSPSLFHSYSKALLSLPAQAPNRQIGLQHNGAAAQNSINERGTGWVLINGEPTLRAGAFLTIVGARSGVDNTYFVTEIEHQYRRGQGYTSRCELVQQWQGLGSSST